LLLQRKCDLYWPQDGTAKFGMIEVTMLRETTMATFTVRTFRIRHTRVKVANAKTGGVTAAEHANERYVVQFQFTVWPDHGVPDSPLSLLSFVRRTAEANKDSDAPVLVHCRFVP
jgi:receptor-type tyrosine-protein phosphatase gamma